MLMYVYGFNVDVCVGIYSVNVCVGIYGIDVCVLFNTNIVYMSVFKGNCSVEVSSKPRSVKPVKSESML